MRVTREVKLSETVKSVCGKVKNIYVKKIEEKESKNNDLRCLKMQKNGAWRKKPSSESCGDTWWMIWKQMGCKTVKDKNTTLVDKLEKR